MASLGCGRWTIGGGWAVGAVNAPACADGPRVGVYFLLPDTAYSGHGLCPSARAHVTGVDPTGVLCFEKFNRWSLDWGAFLRAPIEAEKVAVAWERVRSGSVWNRRRGICWFRRRPRDGPWADYLGLGLLWRGRVDVAMAG